MADIALTSVNRKTTDILANLLVEEFTRLYWLREDLEWIQREMRWIQKFLKDADAREFKSHGSANLESGVRELADDVEDIIDTYSCDAKMEQEQISILFATYVITMLTINL